jgi:hypothetical protein
MGVNPLHRSIKTNNDSTEPWPEKLPLFYEKVKPIADARFNQSQASQVSCSSNNLNQNDLPSPNTTERISSHEEASTGVWNISASSAKIMLENLRGTTLRNPEKELMYSDTLGELRPLDALEELKAINILNEGRSMNASVDFEPIDPLEELSDGNNISMLYVLLKKTLVEEGTIEIDANDIIKNFKDNEEEKLQRFEIIDRLFVCLQTENSANLKIRVQNLKNYCSESNFRVNALFHLLDYFGLEKLQKDYFEPFNEKFPEIFINEAPVSIQSLVLPRMLGTELKSLKLERLEKLTYLDLSNAYNSLNPIQRVINHILFPLNMPESNLTAKQFNAIPHKDRLERFKLSKCFHQRLEYKANPLDLTRFDFSGLKNIRILDLKGCKKLTAKLFNSIPRNKLEKVFLPYMQIITGFDILD